MYPYAILTKKGLLHAMEDFLSVVSLTDQNLLYGGIFDGHGGSLTAKYCSENLGQYFLRELLEGSSQGNASAVFHIAYLKLGWEVVEQISGSCAVTFCLANNQLTVANVGDSRVVLVSRSGVKELTITHTPYNLKETERVRRCGGNIGREGEGTRLHLMSESGGLAVTRAFGDVSWRCAGGLTFAPDVAEHQLTPDDLCVVAASDGLFDRVSNGQIATIAQSRLNNKQAFLSEITQALAYEARLAGSHDDISIIVVDLRSGG